MQGEKRRREVAERATETVREALREGDVQLQVRLARAFDFHLSGEVCCMS